MDSLKKEKVIKSTLELVIVTDGFELSGVDGQDWFTVSDILKHSDGKVVGEFEVDGKRFALHVSTAHKCPRCWKYSAKSEDSLCARCEEVV